MKKALLTVLLISLVGCGKQEVLEPRRRAPLNVQQPILPQMSTVNWRVVTDYNAQAEFASVERAEAVPVLMCITPKDYEKLSFNMLNLQNHVAAQKYVIEKFQEYYQ